MQTGQASEVVEHITHRACAFPNVSVLEQVAQRRDIISDKRDSEPQLVLQVFDGLPYLFDMVKRMDR